MELKAEREHGVSSTKINSRPRERNVERMMNGSTGNSNLTSLNSPQSRVAGHCLAAGFVSASQLVVLQLTAPGVPDLPAATPHFVAHPLGSACSHLPNSVGGLNNLSTKHLLTRDPSVYCGLCGIKMMGVHIQTIVLAYVGQSVRIL